MARPSLVFNVLLITHCALGLRIPEPLETFRIGEGPIDDNMLTGTSERVDLMVYGARNAHEMMNMTVIDAEIERDIVKSLEHARRIESKVDPQLKVIYHVFWTGSLNEKTLTSVKSCYYHNIKMTGQEATGNRQIWLWTPDLESLQAKAHLYQRFLPYVTFKKYIYESEYIGTPLDGTDLGQNGSLNHVSGALSATFLADLARDIVLYKYGGFYFDLDILTLRNWDPIIREYPDQMLAYAWESQNYPNNAFLYSPPKHPTMKALFEFMMSRHCKKWGFQSCQLTYNANVPLTVLPVSWFDAGWLDGSFNSIFTNRSSGSKVTLADMYPGAFAYHWHNGWNKKVDSHSLFTQFSDQLETQLSDSSE